MSRCKKCNVIILDDTDRCPLCKNVLESGDEPNVDAYPNAIGVNRRFRLLENILLFLSIVSGCLMVAINHITNPDVAWSLVACLILAYANAVLRMAILGKSGYMFKTLTLVILAVLMLLGIDYLTGYRGWSLDYVLPLGILLIDLTLLILTLVNRRNWQSYMMAQILAILLSLIPVGLRLGGIIKFPYLVWIAFATSVFLFLGTLIIGDRRARTELKRRFHV